MSKEKKELGKVEGAEALDVFDANGQFVRTYTVELHGEKIVEYAEGFAKKIGGTVKKHE